MRTLYLMRHAKSDWDASYVGDHERPLSIRGRKAARRVGKFLKRTEQVPSLILCSTAVRTRETLNIASIGGEWGEIETTFENDLYLTTQDRVIGMIRTLPDGVRSVMIIGHEPTTSVVAGSLIGGSSVLFTTGACARIDLDIDGWGDVHPGIGTLEWHVNPKILKRKA